jgi:hypothetical protein
MPWNLCASDVAWASVKQVLLGAASAQAAKAVRRRALICMVVVLFGACGDE